jgi:hypothetical protein
MATIKVAVNGKPAFTWDGDEDSIKNILEKFPVAARGVGVTPRKLADSCIWHFRTGSLLSEEPAGQEMQMMGVLWKILEAETGNAEHPGKIADYAGSVDFVVDLSPGDPGRFTANITATSWFDA